MADILRDPIWQFLGSVIGLVAIVAGIWAALRGRAKKITYDVILKTPLLNLSLDSAAQKLKLLFKGKPIDNVQIVVVKIANSGAVPIKSEDFEKPIQLCVDDEAKMLEAQVLKAHPDSLSVSISLIENTSVAIEPVLLNPGDYFLIKAVTTPDTNVTIKGRIVGVKEIKTEANKRRSRRIMITIFLWVIGLAIALFIASGFTDYKASFLLVAAGFSFFLGSYILPRLMDWIKDNS